MYYTGNNAFATLRQGLVGAWCPSLPSGGSGNTLPDVSGYGNHGVLTNMSPDDWVSASYGRALDFDGVNDVVIASRTSAPLGQCCMSAWIYPRNVSTYQIIISEDPTDSNPSLRNFVFGYGLTTGRLIAIDFRGASFTIYESNASLTANTWQHAAWNRSSSGMAFFVNGIQSGSTFTYPGALNSNNIPTRIGARAIPSNETYANMLVDDIRIYNRALTESEIRLLASRPGIGLRQESHRNTFYQFPSGARRKRILTGMP